MKIILRHRGPIAISTLLVCLFLVYWKSISFPLFEVPYSYALYADNQQLYSAEIAADEQWRFYPTDKISEKYISALRLYEDEHFYKHAGVNIMSVLRAMYTNLQSGRIVSGGSTISMQLIRLSEGNPPRTIWNKFIEIIKATRLELSMSKQEILTLYSSHAPYGGNIVGIQAASQRYLNKRPNNLSWAEAALLAVLPNAPSLIYPGKNQEKLKFKRNRLLEKIHAHNYLSDLELELAKEEKIPTDWQSIPQNASHLLQYLKSSKEGYHYNTSINPYITEKSHEIIHQNEGLLSSIAAYNLGVLIIDNEKNQVITYIGNKRNLDDSHAPYVDMIQALRSPGSLLKPILYAEAIEHGVISNKSFLIDLPKNYNGYSPQNFSKSFEGLIPADKALERSLNLPFIELLDRYEMTRFYDKLPQYGIKELDKGAGHYGLSLILGSGETTLWSLTNTYSSLIQTINYFLDNNGRYPNAQFKNADILPTEKKEQYTSDQPPVISAGSIYLTLETLKGVKRPNIYGEIGRFNGADGVAWKTGTSVGFRDAWAIGMTSKYTVGVWVGNADGEGRAGLVGGRIAAPILFDIFSSLPLSQDWDIPYDALSEYQVCRISNNRALSYCPKDTILLPHSAYKLPLCSFHKKIHLSSDRNWRVFRDCYDGKTIDTSWFILPPKIAYYVNNSKNYYDSPPPFHQDCNTDEESILGFVYPDNQAEISIPKNINNRDEKLVVSAYHNDDNAVLYWYLNDKYIGNTKHYHEREVNLEKGKHNVMIKDGNGQQRKIVIKILD